MTFKALEGVRIPKIVDAVSDRQGTIILESLTLRGITL
jgi:hypothetical protein